MVNHKTARRGIPRDSAGREFALAPRPELERWQRAVIILTDGAISDADAPGWRERLLDVKDDTLTFVYWLGNADERHLQPVADSFLTHEGALRPALERYFEVLTTAFTSQQVITPVPCASHGP